MLRAARGQMRLVSDFSPYPGVCTPDLTLTYISEACTVCHLRLIDAYDASRSAPPAIIAASMLTLSSVRSDTYIFHLPIITDASMES